MIEITIYDGSYTHLERKFLRNSLDATLFTGVLLYSNNDGSKFNMLNMVNGLNVAEKLVITTTRLQKCANDYEALKILLEATNSSTLSSWSEYLLSESVYCASNITYLDKIHRRMTTAISLAHNKTSLGVLTLTEFHTEMIKQLGFPTNNEVLINVSILHLLHIGVFFKALLYNVKAFRGSSVERLLSVLLYLKQTALM